MQQQVFDHDNRLVRPAQTIYCSCDLLHLLSARLEISHYTFNRGQILPAHYICSGPKISSRIAVLIGACAIVRTSTSLTSLEQRERVWYRVCLEPSKYYLQWKGVRVCVCYIKPQKQPFSVGYFKLGYEYKTINDHLFSLLHVRN